MKVEVDINIPEGWEFVRFGVPSAGDTFLPNWETQVCKANPKKYIQKCDFDGKWVNNYPIIRKSPPKRQISVDSDNQIVTMILPRKEAELLLLLVGNHNNKEVEEVVLEYAEWPYGLTLTVSDLDGNAGQSSLSYQLHNAIRDALEQFKRTTTP